MKRICVLLIALVFCFKIEAQPIKYVRKNAHSAAAKADIEAMRKAFEIMRKMPCNDPLSWYFQGAIHHIPDSIFGQNLFCNQYQTKSQAHTAWSTCPHMQPEFTQYHFLTWHRLYIWHLEKIVRKLSGKIDFALPYWNYNNASTRTLPEQFRIPGSYEKNALYEMSRSPTLMSGRPIDAGSKDGIVTNVKVCSTSNGKTNCRDTIMLMCTVPMGVALDTSYLWETNNIRHFSGELEDGVHNVIHDYVGGAVDSTDAATNIYNRIYQTSSPSLQGMMADVPSAGFDPIFFLHHANIDRLWTAWEHDFPNKKLTWNDFKKAGNWPYIFFDENGGMVTYKSLNEIFEKASNIDYTYDYLQKKPSGTAKSINSLVALNSLPKSVNILDDINLNTELKGTYNQFYLELQKPIQLADNKSFELEITLAIQGASETKLLISLNDDDTKAICDLDKKKIVGLAGLFGSGHHHDNSSKSSSNEHHMGMKNHGTMHHESFEMKELLYDITTELKAQNINNTKKLEITIWQLLQEKDAKIFVKNIIIKEYNW